MLDLIIERTQIIRLQFNAEGVFIVFKDEFIYFPKIQLNYNIAIIIMLYFTLSTQILSNSPVYVETPLLKGGMK
jgi:hypothetical protein